MQCGPYCSGKAHSGSFYYLRQRIYHSLTMFCPSCGAEYTIELKYCNRCGANLNTELATQPQLVPVSLTKPALILGSIMTFLTLGGFGMLISGAVELSRTARLDPGSITAIVIVGMLAIVTMDIFLARLLTKIINASLSSGAVSQPRRSKILANAPVMQLPQPATGRLEGMPSVTEGTTRFFEPAYREPSRTDDPVPAKKSDR